MKTIYLLSGILIIFFSSCSNAPSVKVVSVEYVESINTSTTSITFEGNEVLSLGLNFNFIDDLAPEFDVNTDEHRAQVYRRIVENTHFYIGTKELIAQHGYWPEKSGANYAKSLTLFYIIPENQPKSHLRFECEGAILGDADYTFSYNAF